MTKSTSAAKTFDRIARCGSMWRSARFKVDVRIDAPFARDQSLPESIFERDARQGVFEQLRIRKNA
jgi:hypothetical protein